MTGAFADIVFCLSEDRFDCEMGLRLAILSLQKHCPGASTYAYRPRFDGRFETWARRFPTVTVISGSPDDADQWNCKPQALLPLLAKGYRQAVWLDSDVVVTADCRARFAALDESVLAVAQEPASLPHQGTESRTRGWKMAVRRRLPHTLNSSVLRVTRQHTALLQRWSELLADPAYRAVQHVPFERRPLHMMGDQDVLNALVGGDFADVPIHLLASGIDIIHAGGGLGYSAVERLRGTLRPKPTFLHAAAGKPWLWLGGEPYFSQRNFFSWHRRLLQEVSPYLHEARQYRETLGLDSTWMDRRTAAGALLCAVGCGHFALRGLPLTMAATVIRSVGNGKKVPSA